jgi:hypothetical protein
MYKFLLLFLVLIAYSSHSQIEKLRRKLKVTTCTISKKYYPEQYKDSVEYQKECNSSEVTVFNYDKKGRNKSAFFESKQYTKLNGKDTFLLSTQNVTYNRKGKILTDSVKSQKILYAIKGESSIYIYLTYHSYKYNVINRLKEENFGNNSSNNYYNKNLKRYNYSLWGNLKQEMRFNKNGKLDIVDENFYKKGNLIRSERWLLKKERSSIYVSDRNPINDQKVFLRDTFYRSSSSVYTYDFEKRLISYVNTSNRSENYIFYFYGKDFKKTVYQNDNFSKPRIETVQFDEQNRKKASFTEGGSTYYHYNSDGLLQQMNFYEKRTSDLEYYPNYSIVYEYRCR